MELIDKILKAISEPEYRDNIRKLVVPDAPIDLRGKDQRIRATSNGYIVTLNTYSSVSGEPVIVEEVFEQENALECALASIIDEIGDSEDSERVINKLFIDSEETEETNGEKDVDE